MRKNILAAGMAAALLGLGGLCFAYEETVFPPELKGIWADIGGERTIHITDTGINGDRLEGIDQIVGGSDRGSGTAVFTRRGSLISAEISWDTVSPNYKIFALEGDTYYQLTGKYFESVGGVYLGMKKSDVVKVYGEPDAYDGEGMYQTWKYADDKVQIEFCYDVVDGIVLEKGSPRTFDRSGLGAGNPFSDYSAYYHDGDEEMGMIVASDRDSEYIWFYDGDVFFNSLPY